MDDFWDDIEDVINNDLAQNPPPNQPPNQPPNPLTNPPPIVPQNLAPNIPNFWFQTDLSPDPVMPVMEMRQSHIGYLHDQVCGLYTLEQLAKFHPFEHPDIYGGFADQLAQEIITLIDKKIVPAEPYINPNIQNPFQDHVLKFRGVLEVSDELLDRSDAVAADPDRGYDAFAAACRQIARNIRFFLNEYKLMELPADEVQNFPPTRFFPSHAFGLKRYTRLRLNLIDDFNRLQRFFTDQPMVHNFLVLGDAMNRICLNRLHPADFLPALRQWGFIDDGFNIPKYNPPQPLLRVLRRVRDLMWTYHHIAIDYWDPSLVQRFPSADMLRNQGVGYLEDVLYSMQFCSNNMHLMCPNINQDALNTWKEFFDMEVERVRMVLAQFDTTTRAGLRQAPQPDQLGGPHGLGHAADGLRALSEFNGFPQNLKTAMMEFSTNINAFCAVHGVLGIEVEPKLATLSYPTGLVMTATQRTVLDLINDVHRLNRFIRDADQKARTNITQAEQAITRLLDLCFDRPIVKEKFNPLVEDGYRRIRTARNSSVINSNDLRYYYALCLGNISFLMHGSHPHFLEPNQYPNE